MRFLVLGLFLGAGLSALRAPLGTDLFQVPAASASTRALPAALGFLAAALAIAAAARAWTARTRTGGRPPVGAVLVGAVLGYAAHAAWLLPHLRAGGLLGGLVAVLVIVAAARFAVGRGAAAAAAETPAAGEGAHPERAPRGAVLLGLALVGAGWVLALHPTFHTLRLFGAGLEQDDSVFAVTFGLLVLAGFYLLGRPLAPAGPGRRALFAACAAAAAASVVASRVVQAGIATPRGLDRFVRAYGLNTADHGELVFSALVAATLLVVPALLAGFALGALKSPREWVALLLGAAAARWLAADLQGLLPAFASGALAASRPASALVLPGVGLATVGALAVTFAARDLKAAPRTVSALVAAAAAATVAILGVRPIPVFAPWERVPVQVEHALETPAGLLTVEGLRRELFAVTLDRRFVSPPFERAAVDAEELRAAYGLLPAARRAGASVLLVGQLTPGRALLLGDLGAARVDRSSSWHAAMPALEEHLFEGYELPPGEVLDPRAAREALAAGRYDLVVVPSVRGEAPELPAVEAPAGTVVVAWIDARDFAWRAELPERVLLASAGLADPVVGCVWGLDGDGGERWFDAGPPGARDGAGTLAWLRTAAYKRDELAPAWLFQRLADAAGEEGPNAALMRALELHFAVQRHSSVWDPPAVRVELEDEALELLAHEASRPDPDRFTRGLVDGLAWVLVGKRDIESIYAHLEPIAEAHPGWYDVGLALARADMESLAPEDAAARMEVLTGAPEADALLWSDLAEAHSQTGNHERAVECLREARRMSPGAFERQFAMELVRVGDPDGVRRIEELLAADPEDTELAAYLGPGPLAPRVPEFQPVGDSHFGHDHGHGGHDHGHGGHDHGPGPGGEGPGHEGHGHGHDHDGHDHDH